MFKANYHTHTYRCGHAGTYKDEEYVQHAIESGFEILGFSDHIMLPGFEQEKYRGSFSMCNNYYNSINSLKEKYKDRIDIKLGFEAESFPKYMPYYSELLKNKVIDYLILGNHFSMDRFGGVVNASDMYVYYELAYKAIRSNMFTIFAHPDIFLANVETFNKECYKICEKLIELCIQYDVYLEVNVGGVRNGKKKIGNKERYNYPTTEFFNIASKMNAKCVIGIDAHSPYAISDEKSLIEALNFAKRCNLRLFDEINFKKYE